jgi:hypothetical protein
VPVAVLFLFPEINVRYFVQSLVVSELEEPFGRSKNLQQIQNTKKGSGWHKINGFKTTLIIGKVIAAGTRNRLTGTGLFRKSGI